MTKIGKYPMLHPSPGTMGPCASNHTHKEHQRTQLSSYGPTTADPKTTPSPETPPHPPCANQQELMAQLPMVQGPTMNPVNNRYRHCKIFTYIE